MQGSQQFSHPLKCALMISNCHPDPSIFCTLSCPLSEPWIMASRGLLNGPFGCLMSERRPPKLQNFGTQEGPLLCPLNHLTLFPSQCSHVFRNKINIWLIHTVGAALSSGQKTPLSKHQWKRSIHQMQQSMIRQDRDFVTPIEFKITHAK